MIRRLIGVGFVVVLVGLAFSACSGKSGGDGATGSSGNGCGSSSGSTSAGSCNGLSTCGSPPCKSGCYLKISVVSGEPDTCGGEADQCDTFPDEQGCLMQGCNWSGGGDTSCGDNDGGAVVDGAGGGMADISAYEGTCSGNGGISCSSFYPPNCPPEDHCYSESDFDAGLTAMKCGGEGMPCSSWSSTSHSIGDPTSCRQNHCTWTPG
jgi:hypothetical protein